MDILDNNTIFRDFTKTLQDSTDNCNVERKRLRDAIADMLHEYAKQMRQSLYNIDNPTEICGELAKISEELVILRQEYTDLVSQETNERKEIIEKHNATLRDGIADTLQEYAKQMRQASDDIGNPANICNKLTTLRVEYADLVSIKANECKENIKKYNENRIGGVSNNDIKLRMYEKYIQTPLLAWDVEKSGIIWPIHGWHHCHCGVSAPGTIWLNNFKHTINTAIAAEISKRDATDESKSD